jgi:hypothetical protein
MKRALWIGGGIVAVLVVVGVLAGDEKSSGPPSATPGYELLVSTSSNRSNPSRLNGQSYPAGSSIYVFTSPTTGGIASMVFSVDGSRVRTEMIAPYDLAGSNDSNGTANSHTALAGTHTVSAKINFSSGTSTTVSGTYTGTASLPPPPPPPGDVTVARRIRSINISAFNNADQFLAGAALQDIVHGYRVPYLRIPYRSEFTEASYRKLLGAIKSSGASPQMIVRGNCVADVAASQGVLTLVDEIFPTGEYWVEYGNENDLQCGLSAADYTTGWNRDVPQLKAAHPRARFIGPVNFQYNAPYLLYFLQNASPRPGAVSWHEYGCGTGDTDQYCLDAIGRWGDHLTSAESQFGTAGYRVPVWITEWNMNPQDEARYQSSFIQAWTQQALNKWVEFARAGRIHVAEVYTLASHGMFNGQPSGFQLFNPDNSLTLQGQTFFAGL